MKTENKSMLQEKRTLKPLRWLGASLVLLFVCRVASCAPQGDASSAQAFDYDWPMDHLGSKWIKLRVPMGYGWLNGVADAMEKKVYPNGRPKPANSVVEELLLRALWPDMVPRTEANRDEFRVPGGGRELHVLMRSGAIEDFEGKHYDRLRNSLNVHINAAKHVCFLPPIPPAPPFVTEPIKAICHDRDWPDEKPSRFGLKRLGIDFAKFPDIPVEQYHDLLKNDIYYAPDMGSGLRTVITCNAEEEKTIEDGPQYPVMPQCEHSFIFKPLNAWVQIGYRRIYLKDWQAIQSAWEKLLQSMIVAPQPVSASAPKKK